MAGVFAVLACSSSLDDNRPTSLSTSGPVCDEYYDALKAHLALCLGSLRLGSPQGLMHDKERFRLLCSAALEAPGTPPDTAWLTECSENLRGSPACALDMPPCVVPVGTLPDGASCGTSLQCESGHCRRASALVSSLNVIDISLGATCGHCAQRAAVGEACEPGTTECARGATCVDNRCVMRMAVEEGGGCGRSSAAVCAPGLYCASGGTCIKPGGAGASCMSPEDCERPLECISSQCAMPLPEGAACSSWFDCASGSCDPAMHICVNVAYVKPGDRCNGDSVSCETGTCGAGRCPKILGDGSACDAESIVAICDSYAVCRGGKCEVPAPKTCK